MKKTLPFIAIIIALIAYAYAYGVMRPPAPHTTATTTARVESSAASSSALNSPSASSTAVSAPQESVTITAASSTYTAAIHDGESVADAMQQLADSGQGFTYTAENYPGMGIFVESIDGVKNSHGNYWFLYVNGRSSDLGASQTKLHAGDSVEWRYEKSH